MDRHELTDASCSSSSGVSGSLDRPDVAAYQNGDERGADLLAAFTIASAASIEAIKPRVSTIPSAS